MGYSKKSEVKKINIKKIPHVGKVVDIEMSSKLIAAPIQDKLVEAQVKINAIIRQEMMSVGYTSLEIYRLQGEAKVVDMSKHGLGIYFYIQPNDTSELFNCTMCINVVIEPTLISYTYSTFNKV